MINYLNLSNSEWKRVNNRFSKIRRNNTLINNNSKSSKGSYSQTDGILADIYNIYVNFENLVDNPFDLNKKTRFKKDSDIPKNFSLY